MSEGLVSSEASLLTWQMGHILPVYSHDLPSVCVCVLISSYYKDTSKREIPIGLEPTLMTSFQLNCLFNYSISTQSHSEVLTGCQGRCQHMNFGVGQGNTIQPITATLKLQKAQEQNCLECLILFPLPYPTASLCVRVQLNESNNKRENPLGLVRLNNS